MPARWCCIPTARSKAAMIRAPTAEPQAYKVQVTARFALADENASLHSAALRAMFPPMRKHFAHIVPCAFAAILAASGAASAQPHVWVTMKSEVVYAPDGSVTGVRHAWTFDDMFSVFATQGIDTKTKGEFTRDELKPLAQTNVESLKDFDYFTYAKSDGKKLEFAEPLGDYYLDYDSKETVLTLHFTLPLKRPLK